MNKLLILLLVLLSSCTVTKKHIERTEELKTKLDSVINIKQKVIVDSVVIFKDRIVTKPINTITEIPIECDKYGKIKDLTYKVNSGRNKLNAVIRDNKLLIYAVIDSTYNSVEKEIKSKYEYKLDSLISINKELEKKTVDVLKVKKEPFFLAHLYCIGIIFVLLSILFFFLKK